MCLKNGNWNEKATISITSRNGPQGFSQHRCIFMHNSSVASLPFLSWKPIEKPLVMVLKECPSCSVWRWQMQWVALSSQCGSALTWLRMVGHHQLGTAGALPCLSTTLPCPRSTCASWVLLFTHSKLHLTHSCLGHLSYKQAHSQWWYTFRSYRLVCDAHQDLLAADGLMDFKSLVKLLSMFF